MLFRIIQITLFFYAGLGSLQGYMPPAVPYAPAAGEPGSTAMAYDDQGILNWAVEVEEVVFGSDVEDSPLWRTPESALGPAGDRNANVLVLGRSGSAVLEFLPGIRDGAGDDFVVFENAFSDTFLELGFVEVSSDGEHFVRFPNYSLTNSPVGSWGTVSPTFVHGFAGKYLSGYGTPFDLTILTEAYDAAVKGEGGFSASFRNSLLANFSFLDMEKIRFVRIIDIVGDGTERDCEGFVIYDPYPTVITAGFDLDAVGVLHEAAITEISFAQWSASFGLAVHEGADTDRDGWPQYLEYLMGSNPESAASVPVFHVRPEMDGGVHIRYSASVAAQGKPRIETSTDGSVWSRPVVSSAGREGILEMFEGTLESGIFFRLTGDY